MQSKQLSWSRSMLVLMILFSNTLIAQDYKASLEGITKVRIISETTLQIKPSNTDLLIIKESENNRNNTPEKPEGLKSMGSFESDNTGYGVYLTKVGSVLSLKGLRDRTSEDLVVNIPRDMDISLEIIDNNDIYLEGFTSTVEAKVHNGGIYLKNVTGPIVAENKVGEISVVFGELNQSYPMSIVSMNGDIDISIPSGAKANVTVKVPRGDFMTDFDVNRKEDFEGRVARSIQTKINGGGVELMLHTLKGNIYLRKIK